MGMWVVILSVTISAATAFVIAARVRREVLDYVEKICELNVDCVKEIKELSLTKVHDLVDIINRSKNE